MGKTNPNILRTINQKLSKSSIKSSYKTTEESSFYFFQNLALLKFFTTFFKLKDIFIKNVKIQRSNNFVFFFISYYYTTSYRKVFMQKNIDENEGKYGLINLLTETLNIYTKKKLNFFFIFQNTNKFLLKYKFLFNYKYFLRKLARDVNYLILGNKKFNPFLKNLINIFLIFLKKSNTAQLLVDYIAYFLQFHKFKKQHRRFLNTIKRLFTLLINYYQFAVIKGLKIQVSGRINGKNRAKKFVFFNYKNVPINTLKAKIIYAKNTAYTKNGTLGIKLWVYEKK